MKILNFGSLNIDYVYAVCHFVRAGETLSSDTRKIYPGGKGLNQSVALARAGADVYHAGCIGREGGFLITQLREAGANVQFIHTVDDVPTGHAIIQVTPSGENCILLFVGANRTVTPAFADEVLRLFGDGDILTLQNEISGIDRLIDMAHTRGMRITLNPSPFEPALLRLPLEKVDYLILNETKGAGYDGIGFPRFRPRIT